MSEITADSLYHSFYLKCISQVQYSFCCGFNRHSHAQSSPPVHTDVSLLISCHKMAQPYKKHYTFPTQKFNHNLIQFVHTSWISNIKLHIQVHTERILYDTSYQFNYPSSQSCPHATRQDNKTHHICLTQPAYGISKSPVLAGFYFRVTLISMKCNARQARLHMYIVNNIATCGQCWPLLSSEFYDIRIFYTTTCITCEVHLYLHLPYKNINIHMQ